MKPEPCDKPAVPWRDRVIELRRVRAGDLIPHENNWRIHTERQTKALEASLQEIGFADVVLARETPDGLQVVDGHLRASLDADAMLPVAVLDVTDGEARLLLATLDPLVGLAETNADAFRDVLDHLHAQEPELQRFLSALREEVTVPAFDPVIAETQSRLDTRAAVTCPECGHSFVPS